MKIVQNPRIISFHLHYRDKFFYISFRKKIKKEEKLIPSYDLETSRFY